MARARTAAVCAALDSWIAGNLLSDDARAAVPSARELNLFRESLSRAVQQL